MNTNPPQNHPVISALSILLYWGFIICLALLLANHTSSGEGETHGNGTGTAEINGNGSGTGNDGVDSNAGKNTQDSGTAASTTNEKTADGTDNTQDPNAENSSSTAHPQTPNPGTDSPSAPQETDQPADDNEQEDTFSSAKIVNAYNESPDSPLKPVPQTPLKHLQNTPKGTSRVKGSDVGKMKGFFGLGKISGNILFLVDVSGSMSTSTPEGMPRLELLKRELKKVINEKLDLLQKKIPPTSPFGLPNTPQGKFFIVTFDNDITISPQNQKPYSFGQKKDLTDSLKFIDSLTSGGGTAMKNAWDGIEKLMKENHIDKVYFLSDGESTDSDHDTLCSHLKKYKQTIHTITLGIHSDLMKDIASQHKGHYREVY